MIYDLSTNSEGGSFLLFAIAVGSFAFLWTTTTKIWALYRMSQMTAFTPSDAFAESGTQPKLTPVPMRLKGDPDTSQAMPPPTGNNAFNVVISGFSRWGLHDNVDETNAPHQPNERGGPSHTTSRSSLARSLGDQNQKGRTCADQERAMQPVTWNEVKIGASPESSFADLEKLRPEHGGISPPPSTLPRPQAGVPSAARVEMPLPPPSASMRGEQASTSASSMTPIRQLNLDLDDHGLGLIEGTPAGDLLKRLHVAYIEHQHQQQQQEEQEQEQQAQERQVQEAQQQRRRRQEKKNDTRRPDTRYQNSASI
jgi:hypothetical protein